MPFISSRQTQPSYDAIVVGSGAAGGQSAYTLAMAGARVLVLEAGRKYDPQSETAMFQLPSHAPLRDASTPDKQYGFHDGSIHSGWTIPDEPYTNAESEPMRQFRWWRQRMLGGRTNHWGRISLRNGPYDFKPHTRNGIGFDWPISYDDLAPYYDKVEMLIGVFGANDGIENAPHSSPGVLLPPPKLRAGELLTRKHAASLGMSVISSHRAILTQAQDATTVPAKLHPGNVKAQRLLAESMRGRAPCFWATECHRGCSIRANYDAHTVHFTPALATGNLDILNLAMAREVIVDDAGRATGVLYIDKETGREERVRGRAVVLAGSAMESVRLLLNSKSSRFPEGLANSTGLVGKYITDSVTSGFGGQIPALENLPLHNEDGSGTHAYIPWWLWPVQKAGKLGFPGGYQLQFTSGRQMPNLSTGTNLDWLSGRSGYAYGSPLKEEARRYYGSMLSFGAQGSMTPNDRCYAELDPSVKDRWGIPVLRFHWQWGDHELNQVKHQQQAIATLIEALGGRYSRPPAKDALTAIRNGGGTNHEVGGAIMGADPARSVTDRWSRTWDVRNLVVADGAVFANTADKNPTLTIMALAWRAAEQLLDDLRKGDA
jgi:choline dehydrogenase-like flavoprotein